MSIDARQDDGVQSQTPLEESYWDSLLSQGEFARTAYQGEESATNLEPVPDFLNKTSANSQSEIETSNFDEDWHTITRIMEDDGVLELKSCWLQPGWFACGMAILTRICTRQSIITFSRNP